LELGFVAWHHRQLSAARELWIQAGPADADGYYWAWRTILDAELALEAGDFAKAMTEFGHLAEFGETMLRLPMQWRAMEGLARVHAARDQWSLAIEHFRRAEQTLAASEQEISVDNGLLGFTSGKSRSAQGLVSALVHEGQVREALAVARVARRRALSAADTAESRQVTGRQDAGGKPPHGKVELSEGSGFEQEVRARYVVSREALGQGVRRLRVAPLTEVASIEQEIVQQRESQRAALEQLLELHRGQRRDSYPAALRAPDPEEVLLLWFEADDGWHGFAQSRDELVHVTAHEPGAKDWLAPLRSLADVSARGAKLVRTPENQRLTILGFGRFQSESVHLLPFGGAPLFEQFDVAYGLDLAPREVKPVAEHRVLLAADSRGDLPLASAEAGRLERLYAARGAEVVSLIGVGLRADAFRHAVEAATVLHFAGHGQLAGTEGWDSWLELAEDTRFTAGDILALPSVPALVVLNACGAAANRDLAKGPGLGLAHAWILAGTETVVAPTEPVPDREAYRFAQAFAQSFIETGSSAQAYRVALGDADTNETPRVSYRLIRP
jgi:hypothetical protein